MKTITQYKEDIKALMKKAADIDAKCVNENRDPNEAELTLQNELLDTVKEYQQIINTMERKERIAQELEKPEKPLTVKDNAKIEVVDSRKKDEFGSLGEQLSAIIAAGQPNGKVDPRLFNAASGLNETVPSDGWFLIQQDFTIKLYEDLFDNGLIAGQCEKIPISGNSNVIKVNGFDEMHKFPGGEDNGLSFKLANLGYYFEFEKKMIVMHDYRTSLSSFFKTFYRYGKGCAEISYKYLRNQSISMMEG